MEEFLALILFLTFNLIKRSSETTISMLVSLLSGISPGVGTVDYLWLMGLLIYTVRAPFHWYILFKTFFPCAGFLCAVVCTCAKKAYAGACRCMQAGMPIYLCLPECVLGIIWVERNGQFQLTISYMNYSIYTLLWRSNLKYIDNLRARYKTTKQKKCTQNAK